VAIAGKGLRIEKEHNVFRGSNRLYLNSCWEAVRSEITCVKQRGF
jgi:hypothetical protein